MNPPFPWFGGKRKVADLVWSRLGDVGNYVEPFAGSLAVLLGRPSVKGRGEIINDKDAYLANFWRAMKANPDEVAAWAGDPVHEADLHARHQWLVDQAGFRERMLVDPDFHDPKVAGWWVWGVSCWLGGGWCNENGMTAAGKSHAKVRCPDQRGVRSTKWGVPNPDQRGVRSTKHLVPNPNQRGVRSTQHLVPNPNQRGVQTCRRVDLSGWFRLLSDRLSKATILCGDWKRACTDCMLFRGGKNGLFLDPPYDVNLGINGKIYSESGGADLNREVTELVVRHQAKDDLRIALCGYEGEYDLDPKWWTKVAWSANRGYSRDNDNRHRERIWFNKACARPDEFVPLLEEEETCR